MNKAQLIDAIASATGVSKSKTSEVLDAFTKVVSEQLAEGNKVSLIGFGSFSVKERKARMGRNPQTGEECEIPAKTVPVFKAGSDLINSVN